MKRLAFNGGEVSPGMGMRCDMDSYGRSCTRLTNFDVAATGGLSRRHGFELFASGLGGEVRLIPYVYSDEEAYLVALCSGSVLVYGQDGAEYAGFFADGMWCYEHPSAVRYVQINSLLLVLSPENPVMVLRRDGNGDWSFKRFEFKCPAWQTVELRDWELTCIPVKAEETVSGVAGYDVSVPLDAPAVERACREGDSLRVSWYTRREEARGNAAQDSGVMPLFMNGLSDTTIVLAGNGFYVIREAEYEYYICTRAWNKGTDYTEGFPSPGNYPDRFARADEVRNDGDFELVASVGAKSSLSKGAKIKYAVRMCDLFYCVRNFVGDNDFRGSTDPKDYPKHFVQGLPIGVALPCGGKWQFYCSGSWVGAYEVRRCYETADLAGAWEHAGESVSPAEAPANNLVTGNEDEECWLRLFLMRVRMGVSGVREYWPKDVCGNRLVVYPYRHDMRLVRNGNPEPGLHVHDPSFYDESAVKIPLAAPLVTEDWSWCAFREEYGYPCVGALHEGRLVLAGTGAQPQTIWLSRSDDLNNFRMGDGDDAGMLLEMQTGTQAAIRWMLSRSDALLVGTMDGEWVVRAGVNAGVLTGANARIFNQGNNGSAAVPAVAAADRVLYVERGGGRVYEFGYHVETDGYQSADLTVLADHIAAGEGGITGGAVLRKPCMRAVFTTAGGNLLLMTYNTMHNVNAWHRYEYGTEEGMFLDGRMESVAVLPHGNCGDRVYVSARSTEPGSEARAAECWLILHGTSLEPGDARHTGVKVAGRAYEVDGTQEPDAWHEALEEAINADDSCPVEARLGAGFWAFRYLILTAKDEGASGNYIEVGPVDEDSELVDGNCWMMTGGADMVPDGERRYILVLDQDGEVYADYQVGATGEAATADYASVVETTVFSGTEYDDRRVKVGSLQVFLHGEVPDAGDVEFSSGDGYRPTDGRELHEGWNQVAPGANWRYGPYVGVRVTGDAPCTILAMQAGSPLTT